MSGAFHHTSEGTLPKTPKGTCLGQIVDNPSGCREGRGAGFLIIEGCSGIESCKKILNGGSGEPGGQFEHSRRGSACANVGVSASFNNTIEGTVSINTSVVLGLGAGLGGFAVG